MEGVVGIEVVLCLVMTVKSTDLATKRSEGLLKKMALSGGC